MKIEKSLEEILKRFDKVDKTIEKIDTKLDRINARIDELELKLEKKCEEIEEKLTLKANLKTVDGLQERIRFLEKFKDDHEKTLIMQESYDKRLNILIHGIEEDNDNVWEKRESTIEKFKNFLTNGLKIDDPDDVKFVDIHRLPQHPIKKFGKNSHRAIIVKLLTTGEKKLIFRNVKHLKEFNAKRRIDGELTPYVFVTEHLPQKFQAQRKLLLPAYKEAKKNKQKTLWKAINGNYNLFIDDKQINPPMITPKSS